MVYVVELIESSKRFGGDVLVLEGNMIKLTENLKREVTFNGKRRFVDFTTISELYLPQNNSIYYKRKI